MSSAQEGYYEWDRTPAPETPQSILAAPDFEQRVADLANAAGQAGDAEQVFLCEAALGWAGLSAGEVEEARLACAEALRDGGRS